MCANGGTKWVQGGGLTRGGRKRKKRGANWGHGLGTGVMFRGLVKPPLWLAKTGGRKGGKNSSRGFGRCEQRLGTPGGCAGRQKGSKVQGKEEKTGNEWTKRQKLL